jgi:hypothetical protein
LFAVKVASSSASDQARLVSGKHIRAVLRRHCPSSSYPILRHWSFDVPATLLVCRNFHVKLETSDVTTIRPIPNKVVESGGIYVLSCVVSTDRGRPLSFLMHRSGHCLIVLKRFCTLVRGRSAGLLVIIRDRCRSPLRPNCPSSVTRLFTQTLLQQKVPACTVTTLS